MLPKKSKHVFVSTGPFLITSLKFLSSPFVSTFLIFPWLLILATNPMNIRWSHTCQRKDGKSVRTTKQDSQVGYLSSAKVICYFPMNHSVKSFHKRLRTWDLQHICTCYVIASAFLWCKMDTLENKDKTEGLAVWFLFSFFSCFCKQLLVQKVSINWALVLPCSLHELLHDLLSDCVLILFLSTQILNISHIINGQAINPKHVFTAMGLGRRKGERIIPLKFLM